MHRGSLWELLRLRGITREILELIRAIYYTGTDSAVRWGGNTYEFFTVKTGVRLGCVLASSLFSVCMVWLMSRTIGSRLRGESFGKERFTDLDFANDAVIFTLNMQSLVESLAALSEESESLGLRVSWIKTKIQNFLQAVN